MRRVSNKRSVAAVLVAVGLGIGVLVATAHGGGDQPLARPTPPPATLHPTPAQATQTALQNAADVARGYAARTTSNVTASGPASTSASTAEVVTGTTLGDASKLLDAGDGTVGGPPAATPVTIVEVSGSFAPRSSPAGVSVPAEKYLTVTTNDTTGAVISFGISPREAPLAQLGDARTADLPTPDVTP